MKRWCIGLVMSGFLMGSALAGEVHSPQNPSASPIATAKNQSKPKVNFSPIFIQLSDVMGAVKAGDTGTAQQDLKTIKDELDKIDTSSSQGQEVLVALDTAIATPNQANLSAFSIALYALEKQQNPVDYTAKQAQFANKIVPAYERLAKAINTATPTAQEALRDEYNRFNAVWLAHERVVRNTSMGHYGKIETAMALIRVAIESEPMNIEAMKAQSHTLKSAIDSYNQGETVQSAPVAGVTLGTGIGLLREGLSAFEVGDNATGQAKLAEFINIWTVIEGEVSTRNPSLYSRIESQIPIIMASGHQPKEQQNLQNLINELTAINPEAAYTVLDSMLILLREGLEALLIVMALLSALTAAKQHKGKKYVYAGVVAGLFASVAGAVALQQLFPAMTSGANREMLEGIVGIVAVVMMLGVGAWLHSKSSVRSWNAFIKRHMGEVLTTGSFVSLFGLSFLSVFREGAETILFYVGILPNISMRDFLLGIVMALGILVVLAVLMLKTSVKLPIPTLFKVLTWLIYFLGFKILGISLSALQLTGHLTRTMIVYLPAIESIGFYPTVQTVFAQSMYIVLVFGLWWYARRLEAVEMVKA